MAALAVATTTQEVLTHSAFSFASRSGGKGHEVKVVAAKDGQSMYLSCTCPGGKFAWAGKNPGAGCWAMKAVRQALGL